MPAILGGLAALVTALVGATITDLGPWYQALRQPDWAPPPAAYGVVWTFIFASVAVAGVSAWVATPDRRAAEGLIGLFALNGFLNLAWSFLFFRLHRPDWAAWEVILLWLSIVALIWACGRYSRAAAWLLVPYLMWVGIAGALNWEVVRLNAPF